MTQRADLPISDSKLSTGEDVEAHLAGAEPLPVDAEDVEAHIGLGAGVPTVGGIATESELKQG